MPFTSQTWQVGTGYAGSTDDSKVRKRQRKTALEKEKGEILSFAAQLDSAQASLARQLPGEVVLDTIKKVLRNIAVWLSHKRLYSAALTCCDLIVSNHPQCLGSQDSSESLINAILESAESATQIVLHKRDYTAVDVSIAQRVISLRDLALVESKKAVAVPELTMIDNDEHYRMTLRPYAFDFAPSLNGHAFAQPVKSQTSVQERKKLMREFAAYKTSLPIERGSSIFVRASESQSNLVRALIIGPEDTPYANGMFVFDILLDGYPRKAPKVKFMTTNGGTFRFSPNLYADGKVCLSLLGTWQGPGWQPNESTLLQVLVSIQSLILVPDPYFNEPGYETSMHTNHGKQKSNQYTRNVISMTVRAAILPFLTKPDMYPEFSEIVSKHFALKANAIRSQIQEWNRTASLSQGQQCVQLLDAIISSQAKKRRPRTQHMAKKPRGDVSTCDVICLDDDEPDVSVLTKVHDDGIIEILD